MTPGPYSSNLKVWRACGPSGETLDGPEKRPSSWRTGQVLGLMVSRDQGCKIHRISSCIMYNTYYVLYNTYYMYYFPCIILTGRETKPLRYSACRVAPLVSALGSESWQRRHSPCPTMAPVWASSRRWSWADLATMQLKSKQSAIARSLTSVQRLAASRKRST